MSNKFEELLNATSKKNNSTNKMNTTLAEQLDNFQQFDKAEKIMGRINHTNNTTSSKDPYINVSYMLPKSYINKINDIIRKCMREEIPTNKSEIIRLGIKMISELSIDKLTDRLVEVRVEKGPRKNN